jgi:hypothetical protein
MIASATSATPTPATTSSQKWFAVAITLNHTHAGQSAQATFATGLRQTKASETPTIRASAACRLGIAAYGFDASSIRPLPWLSPPIEPRVSAKPKPGTCAAAPSGAST